MLTQRRAQKIRKKWLFLNYFLWDRPNTLRVRFVRTHTIMIVVVDCTVYTMCRAARVRSAVRIVRIRTLEHHDRIVWW